MRPRKQFLLQGIELETTRAQSGPITVRYVDILTQMVWQSVIFSGKIILRITAICADIGHLKEFCWSELQVVQRGVTLCTRIVRLSPRGRVDFFTVMGPGKKHLSRNFASSVYSITCDKHRWRKDVCCWASTVRACAGGSDMRTKVMLFIMGMLLYDYLLPSEQQLVKKFSESGKLVLDLCQVGYDKDIAVAVKRIIYIVAKYPATDTTK